ncbi:MAG: winged helix-turn-helix transcriptional regulator [Treponema sp.]|nr:winged helix-turn-helix transcriptional regulator [Treponema sp.]
MELNKRLMINICGLYYEQDLTQQEIAKQLGLSRIKVSRLLKKAKADGIVKISIDYSGTFLELEHKLKEQYRLKNAVVVDGSASSSAKKKVAAAAALFLENNLAAGTTLAAGWGTTLAQIPDFLHEGRVKKILFSPIIGGHGRDIDIHASSITARLAQKTACDSLYLLSPAFAQTAAEKKILLNDRVINEVLQRSAAADYALFSLGNPMIKNSSAAMSGYFTGEEINYLHREKVVCDVASVLFLDAECRPCCEEIFKRSIGIKAEELQKIPVKICVVEGVSKHLSVRTALRAKLIDVLILDDRTAHYLVDEAA